MARFRTAETPAGERDHLREKKAGEARLIMAIGLALHALAIYLAPVQAEAKDDRP